MQEEALTYFRLFDPCRSFAAHAQKLVRKLGHA